MHRIDNTTAVPTLPEIKAPGTPGFFSNGDFLRGVAPTVVEADWMNAVQEELCRTVEASGQTVDKGTHDQLLRAIRQLIARGRKSPGEVFVFAGRAVPAGSLHCDGAAYSRAEYADLFAAIDTLYGDGDGSTTFQVPKLEEGMVVVHTRDPEAVGTTTLGAGIAHSHSTQISDEGDHTHYVAALAGGSHNHAASATAAGDHTHATWTDAQGHHGHDGSTHGGGAHQHGIHAQALGHQVPGAGNGGTPNRISALTDAAGDHAHNFATNGAGNHAHNIGMNGAGNHAHTISVVAAANHTHAVENRAAGAHRHTVTVASTGGQYNLAAGLRMIYCIAY